MAKKAGIKIAREANHFFDVAIIVFFVKIHLKPVRQQGRKARCSFEVCLCGSLHPEFLQRFLACLLACLLTSFARWYCLCLHCLSVVVSVRRYSFAFYVIDMWCVWSCSCCLLCLCELLYLLFLGSLLHTPKIIEPAALFASPVKHMSVKCLYVKNDPNLMPKWTQKGPPEGPQNQPKWPPWASYVSDPSQRGPEAQNLIKQMKNTLRNLSGKKDGKRNVISKCALVWLHRA